MPEGLSNFRNDMDKIAHMASSGNISSKAQRYLRAYESGLPQDITVRWFAKESLDSMKARVDDLTSQNLEVWISQGLPWNPNVDSQLTSVERKTDLIKGIVSLDDFHKRAVPQLSQWESGSWAKMFYDTPQRSLIGGTIRFDTNHSDSNQAVDRRAIRFEAASGISDVRDLDRQMSAKQVLIIHPKADIIHQIEASLKTLETSVVSSTNLKQALPFIVEFVKQHTPQETPKAKASDPKVIMLDFDTSKDVSLEIVKALKSSRDTSYIPIIPITEDEESLPSSLIPMISSIVRLPIDNDNLNKNVYFTGFQLYGGPNGFKYPNLGLNTQHEINSLLNTVFGPGGAYRRMMVQIANTEQRPTIAFEFKLVPLDPYDFFFLDYEWSGKKDPLHRFDWAFNYN
jgi:CheY-like chemotaxis protein